MEPVQPTQSPEVGIIKRAFPFKKIFLIILTILLITASSVGGYYLGKTKSNLAPPIKTPPKQEIGIKEDDLPFSIELLQNPLISQWVAAVKGQLVEKTSDSITLQNKQGQTITIPLKISNNDIEIWTKFFVKKDDEVPESINLNDIPIGATLNGEFFILPLAKNKNRIVGSQFVYDQGSQ